MDENHDTIKIRVCWFSDECFIMGGVNWHIAQGLRDNNEILSMNSCINWHGSHGSKSLQNTKHANKFLGCRGGYYSLRMNGNGLIIYSKKYIITDQVNSLSENALDIIGSKS